MTSAALTPSAKTWVLNQAGIGLRARGRLQEALPTMRAGLRTEEDVVGLGKRRRVGVQCE